MVYDLQYHHNDDNDSNCDPNDYDEDEKRIVSWEAEYVTMEEEESMKVTDDYILKDGDISYHEYISNDSEEEKIGGESEV